MLAAGCQDRSILKKSTRIAKQYRLTFIPDEREHIVYLILIEHREHVYE
jgi:mRNA-degrading endonuclease RelE of RelBE toxin-antitoxin system